MSSGPLFEFLILPVTTPQTHTVHGDQVPSVVTGIKKETLLQRVRAGMLHCFICTPTVLKDTLTNKRLYITGMHSALLWFPRVKEWREECSHRILVGTL